MNSAAGTTTTGSSSSTPNSPISPTPSSSTASPASILERRNRRRSSALSGSHPAEVPLTDSDHRLAVQVARINWQNAREAGLQAPHQPLPTLVVPALDLNSDSSGTPEDPTVSSSIEKTPTQATFRPLSSQRTALSVSRSHTRDGSRSTTTFQLSPIKDESDSKTPTEQDPNTSPIRAEQNLSTVLSLVRNEHRLSPNRIPLNGDYEPSPPLSARRVQLSPYRSFTRRMYTSSPLESTFSQAEDEGVEQLLSEDADSEGHVESSDTEDVATPSSPQEPFPPFESN
jgi:hypothetical protein